MRNCGRVKHVRHIHPGIAPWMASAASAVRSRKATSRTSKEFWRQTIISLPLKSAQVCRNSPIPRSSTHHYLAASLKLLVQLIAKLMSRPLHHQRRQRHTPHRICRWQLHIPITTTAVCFTVCTTMPTAPISLLVSLTGLRFVSCTWWTRVETQQILRPTRFCNLEMLCFPR